MAVVLFVCVLAAAACGSRDPGQAGSGTATPSPTVPPTAGPTATATVPPPTATTPPHTPTPSPTVTPPAGTVTETLPVSSISIPVCISGFNGGLGNQGTAPGPTPTPLPDPGNRDHAVVAAEVSAYLARAMAPARHLSAWNDWFVETWPLAETGEEQAALLQLFGTRLSQACDAIAAVDSFPPEAAGVNTLLGEAARARHAWAQLAIGQLQCCGKAEGGGIATGNSGTSDAVRAVLPALGDFATEHGVTVEEGYLLEHTVLAIEAELPPGWLAFADGLSIVLVAPFEAQAERLAALGPASWHEGAGVKVRRLRNTGVLTPAEASAQFTGLVARQGSVESTEETHVSGLSALRHRLATGSEWSAAMTVAVAGEFTYFIETGCVPHVAGSCEAVEAMAEALVIAR